MMYGETEFIVPSVFFIDRQSDARYEQLNMNEIYARGNRLYCAVFL